MHSQPGLDPATARRGKLLPRPAYEKLIELVDADNEYFGFQSAARDDFVITPAKHMECKDCRASYVRNLQQKLGFVNDLKALYDMLEPKQDDPPLEYDPSDAEIRSEDKFVYIVHRKFVTSLRSIVTDLMKTVVHADATEVPVRNRLRTGAESIAEGIDALDVSDLVSFFENEHIRPSDGDDPVDGTVNSGIACK